MDTIKFKKFKLPKLILICGVMLLLKPGSAEAMHISEGILPAPWAGFWFLMSLPFLIIGLRKLKKQSLENPNFKPLIGLVGSAVFIISCMPIPVPGVGSCSHPCGTGMAAIIIGPSLTVVVTSVALLLQALFLAHGGLTTLGADIFSMGVAGAYSGYLVFKLARKLGAPWLVAAFMAGLISDWATYSLTSLELASGLSASGEFASNFFMILIAFIPTQVPLGIFEGIITAGAFKFIHARRPQLLASIETGGLT